MIPSIMIFSETMRFSSGMRTCDDEDQAKRKNLGSNSQDVCKPNIHAIQEKLWTRSMSAVLAEGPATLQNLVKTWY